MHPASHTRRFSAFISYRHADNTQEGRRWAEWLHRALERYVVPPDLIGTPNLRGEPIRDSLYPIFRDEDELPANADLATGIRAALEVSDHLIVLCSPRSAISPWVRKEVREFKELGRSDRILAIIIAGEPNADDPAKAREGILLDEECFCEELRFGAVRDDGTLDWTIRTEPLAADLRPVGTRAEGFVTAEAYREHLTLKSSLSPEKITERVDAYRQQLEHSILKVIAGLLGVPLGQLLDRNLAHRTALAEEEAQRQRQIAERERQLAEAALLAKAEAEAANERTRIAMNDLQLQLERSQLEEGRAWLERAKAAENKGDHLSALMLAGRAVGFEGYGRQHLERGSRTAVFPLLLGKTMTDPVLEQERQKEKEDLTQFIDSVQPTHLPLWAGRLSELVTCVAFSPDGGIIASGSLNRTIKLWDAYTGKDLATLAGHTREVTSVAFSPDGSRLASGSLDSTIKLWEVTSGKDLANLTGHTREVTSVAFSPDGTRLASGSGEFGKPGEIKIWNARTGKELGSLFGHTKEVTSVAFSSDGNRLASGSQDNTIKIWDFRTGKQLASLAGHLDKVWSVAFSPDGKRLASGAGETEITVAYGEIKLWDTASGKELVSLAGHKSEVTSIAFNSDGSRLASGSKDNTVKIWDIASGRNLSTFAGHTNWVSSVAFSPDGSRLCTGSYDRTIKLWDAARGRELTGFSNDKYQATRVAFSPDGTSIAGAMEDATIRLWDTATGKELAALVGHKLQVTSMAFSADGRCLAGGSTFIKLWNTATGKEIAILSGHTSGVTAAVFSLDGKFLASTGDKTIKLWDLATGKELTTFAGHTGGVNTLAFGPDGSNIASGSWDKTIKLWNLTTGKLLATFVGHKDWVSEVAFSPDGKRIASGSSNTTIKLWDVALGKELALDAEGFANAKQWLADRNHRISPGHQRIAGWDPNDKMRISIVPCQAPLDLTAPLRAGLLALSGRMLEFPAIKGPTLMIHYRQDTLAQLADCKLAPERRAELRMELCTKSSQFRAATALWQRLLQGEWPGFEGGTVPKDQAPATIPDDSPIRRLYLLALIDATKHPQIHGHPTICQTAAQIAPVLTKEMMATPTISLAMMSLMQTLAKDDSPDMSAPRAALLKRLDDVATKEWLAVLREGK